jgi:hypothetical protein
MRLFFPVLRSCANFPDLLGCRGRELSFDIVRNYRSVFSVLERDIMDEWSSVLQLTLTPIC